MNFSKMKVGARLGCGFALVLILLVAVTVLGVSRMAKFQERLEQIVNVKNVETRLVMVMRQLINERTASLKTLTLLTDAADMQPELVRIKEQTERYAAAERKLEQIFSAEANTSAQEKALLEKIMGLGRKATPLIDKALEFWKADKPEEATKVLIKEIRPVQKAWSEALDELLALEDKLNERAAADAEESFVNARTMMLALGGLAVLGGVVAAAIITHGLLRQLGGEPAYAATIAGSIANGNLSIAIDTKEADRSSLLVEMKAMRDSLVNIVGRVRSGTDTIATASSQIAAGNLDLSSRTEQQAGSLEKTTASMEKLTNAVIQNAENASRANALAAAASSVARKGGAVVAQVVDTMGSINDSSRKIVDIISVIDGIAFQTNILALNAAVEAARAGEQGRGFAVVATEVRNLAQRSAAAAKEIKGLIGDSTEKVEAGSKLVEQAGMTMEEVVASVKHVTDIISEITEASEAQRDGIAQVNSAIVEMDRVTQQNAALVEQASAAAQSLQNQAAELAGVVRIFDLGANGSLTPGEPEAGPGHAGRPAIGDAVLAMPTRANRQHLRLTA